MPTVTKKKYPCTFPGCKSSFDQPASVNRHFNLKHEEEQLKQLESSGPVQFAPNKVGSPVSPQLVSVLDNTPPLPTNETHPVDLDQDPALQQLEINGPSTGHLPSPSGWSRREYFPGAGAVFPPPPHLLKLQDEQSQLRESNPYFPFMSRFEAELATFIVDLNLSGTAVRRLLHLFNIFSPDEQAVAPFRNRDQIFNKLDQSLTRPIRWHKATISLKHQPYASRIPPTWKVNATFWFRDITQVITSLFANPAYEQETSYAPYKELNTMGKRTYSEPFTGDWVWDEQSTMPKGATCIALQGSSDKTVASSMKGNAEFWPLGLCLLNHSNRLRQSSKSGANLLCGLIPIPQASEQDRKSDLFSIYCRELFHECLRLFFSALPPEAKTGMPLLGPDGQARNACVRIGSWMADYMEQILITLVLNGRCVICKMPRDLMEQAGVDEPRTNNDSLKARNLLSSNELKEYGLHNNHTFLVGQEWLGDVHQMLTPDILHQIDKPYLDHVVKWTFALIENRDKGARGPRVKVEIEKRLRLIPPFQGGRYFGGGIDFTQWTAQDSRDLRKVLIGCLPNLNLPVNVLRSHRVEANIGNYVHFRRHDEETISDLEENINLYYKFREVFDSVRQGKNGKFLGYCLPRKHVRNHYPQLIRKFGACVGHTTDVSEHSWIEFIKDPYGHGSKHHVEEQLCRAADRKYQVRAIASYLELRGEPSLQELSTIRQKGHKARSPIHVSFKNRTQWSLPVKPVHGGARTIEQLQQSRDDLADLSVEVQQYIYYRYNPNASRQRHLKASDLAGCQYHDSVSYFYSLTFRSPQPHLPERTANGDYPYIQCILRCNPNWRARDDNTYYDDSPLSTPRYDAALVADRSAHAADGYDGMSVCRVKLIFELNLGGIKEEVAFVEWYEKEGGSEADENTGLFKIRKKRGPDGQLSTSVISLNILIRPCPLIPRFERETPANLRRCDVMDYYDHFWVNIYADLHMFSAVF